MKKIIGLLAAVAMMALMAGPAAASNAGVFVGDADVAQDPSVCGVGGGAGLGLPIIHGTDKTGTYGLHVTATTVKDLDGAALDVCGKLRAVAGIGAACGMSNGYDGEGTLVEGNGTTQIHDVEWVASAGGTLPFTGHTSDKKVGTLVGVAQAQGAAPCLDKAATNFVVAGAFVLITDV